MFGAINSKNGIHISYADTSDIKNIENLIRKETKAVYIETPTNPMMNVTDIKAVADITKKHNLILIVDNTFLTPYLQNPLLLGTDIVLHSGTKFLAGHNDTLSGFLVTANKDVAEKLRYILKTTGAGLPPFDSWLVLRGIKTLPLRIERQHQNAERIAEWLKKHDKVTSVYYAGLPDHPGYSINKKQAKGAGSMISFHVNSEETAIKLLENLKLIRYAESLGGVESLMTYPMLQTHADVPEEEREAKLINKYLLRLSVGIEHIGDLIADLDQALSN